ncbi:MAG: hypothetical protein WCT46_02085 [Candidatus Gracilibacteria bacterium]|jgi:hypothetical protein
MGNEDVVPTADERLDYIAALTERLNEVTADLVSFLRQQSGNEGIKVRKNGTPMYRFTEAFDMLTMEQRHAYIAGTKFGRVTRPEDQEMLYRFGQVMWSDIMDYSYDTREGKPLNRICRNIEELIVRYFSQE